MDGWLDDDSVLFGYSASAVGVIYNTTVFSTLDADWKDLGNAEYQDQLAIPDPEKSGACKDLWRAMWSRMAGMIFRLWLTTV